MNKPPTTLNWRKSTRSASGGNANCVEMAHDGAEVLMRDSKLSTDSTRIVITADAWAALSRAIKDNSLTS